MSEERLRDELERARAELREARARIHAIEASSFWKLRNAWWRLKTRITGQPDPHAQPFPTGEPGAPPVAAAAPREDPRVTVAVRFAPGSPPPEPLLDALLAHTRSPYDLTIVDDGTTGALAARLAGLAETQRARLVRHETPQGWGRCANAALASAHGEFVALLPASARPGPRWLERFVSALHGHDGHDNAAAALPLAADLPAGTGAECFSALLASDPSIHPVIARLAPSGGLLVRRDVPRFDDADEPASLAAFGEALRARGLAGVMADDVWLGATPLTEDADRVTAALRRRAALLPAVAERRREMRARFEGRRVLFVLPVMERGGGANVVFSEALEMVRMGVDARVLNLAHFRRSFERHYPVDEVPVLWADPHEIPREAMRARFDAVVATANTSVEWLAPLARARRAPVLGYYVQDYEPHFYPEGSPGHRQAFASYTLVPGMRLFTKTDWNRGELQRLAGVSACVVGPSYDAATFRPRAPEPPDAPVRLAAMVRPSSARRQPKLTMDVLEKLHARFGKAVSLVTFGEDKEHADWPPLERSFPHESVGVAESGRLAEIYSGVHAFLDFSTYQAMGLSAMEAMACGATAVLPRAGGADSFAKDGEDVLLADTADAEACFLAAARLVEDAALRRCLAARAPEAVERFHPAFAAANVLSALFPDA